MLRLATRLATATKAPQVKTVKSFSAPNNLIKSTLKATTFSSAKSGNYVQKSFYSNKREEEVEEEEEEDYVPKSIKEERLISDMKNLINAIGDKQITPDVFEHAFAKDAALAASATSVVNTIGNWKKNELKRQPIVKQPVRVAVTGASGQIGYALLFRIASGEMLGKDQPVILQLLELPQALKPLEGVKMELNDCAFPLLKGVVCTDSANKAFEGADYALLVGAKPRTKGMERGDLLKENAQIFSVQGRALDASANKNVKVLVVGNPANTNAMITSYYAKSIPERNITAMTRLDHSRGLAQLCERTGASVNDIKRFVIWGNHSATQVPDVSNTQIRGKWAKEVINDDAWIKNTFMPTVQQRGAAIINARGASSAASAANAAIDHVRDWVLGTDGEWTSMAIPSDGSYGVDKGLWYSYPVVCSNGEYQIVQNVPIDPFIAQKMDATRKELLDERKGVEHLLK